MRIGILTGGGDVPGLNPCIKAAVYGAIDAGHEVIGIRRGCVHISIGCTFLELIYNG